MTATITLYERTEALNIVAAFIEEHADVIAENGGTLPDELAALLDDAEGEFDSKVEHVALFIRSLGHTADAIKAEEDRLSARRKAIANAAASLTNYLHAHLAGAGKTQVKGVLATVAIQQSPPSVTSSLDECGLRNLAQHAPSFVKIIPEQVALDKDAVKRAYAAGDALPEGIAVTRGTHLRIR